MSSTFEERLKQELMGIAAERIDTTGRPDVIRPSVARRYRTPLAVGAVAAAAAGMVALPAVAGGSEGGAAAYAVSRSSDGTITAKLFNPDGVAGLERELRSRGVKVQLMGMTPASECHELDRKSPEAADRENALLGREGGTLVLRINDRTLPPGWTLLLIKRSGGGQGLGFEEVQQMPICIPDFFVGAPLAHSGIGFAQGGAGSPSVYFGSDFAQGGAGTPPAYPSMIPLQGR